MSSRKAAGPSTAELRETLSKLVADATRSEISTRRRRKLEAEIREITEDLGNLLRKLDPVAEPASVFDPSNPKIVGRFVALALVAQQRLPLAAVPQTYGSGIYAIYYNGALPAYAAISGTESPIYVGTASPSVNNARTAYEQGSKLAERISYHGRNISKAISTLSISDFEFRSLVVQSGWERQAESYLIHLFKPVWNKETRIVSGFGKHGDSAEMRKHGRSPWDTLHPARAWAGESDSDQKSPEQISSELGQHFQSNRIYKDLNEILADFLEELRQV